MRAILIVSLLMLSGCVSLSKARNPTQEDCVAIDKARGVWSVVVYVGAGMAAGGGAVALTQVANRREVRTGASLTALAGAGVAAFAAHETENLTERYVGPCVK